MKIRNLYILTFTFFLSFFFIGESTAQVNRCGNPTYRPKQGDGHTYKDTCSWAYFVWNGGKWYRQFQINQTSAPSFETTTSGITINNTEAIWFNTSNWIYYKAQWITPGNYWAWTSIAVVDINNLVFINGAQEIVGKKTFADTARFKKGLVSEDSIVTKGLTSSELIKTKGLTSSALITTKGLTSDSTITSVGVKSSGTSTKAASENNGVQKDAVIEVTVNTTLDGTYNTIVGVPSSSDIVLTLPVIAAENNGWKYTISKKSASSFNVRVTASGFNHTIISPNSPVVIRNRGGTWQVE